MIVKMEKLIKNLLILLIFATILSCQNSSKSLNENEVQSTHGMLQHNVYFYLHDSIAESEKLEFESGLRKLLSIEEIYKSQVGITGSTKSRDVTDHDFDYSIFTWFKNMDDYEIYAEHPDHLEFIDSYKHLWQNVKVYDSEIKSINEE
jgi:hypothetical protein